MILQADAANEWIRRGRVAGRELRDVEIGNELADIDDIDDALLGELVALKGANGDWYFVDILFTLGRGDRDLLEKRNFRLLRRCAGDEYGAERREQAQAQWC